MYAYDELRDGKLKDAEQVYQTALRFSEDEEVAYDYKMAWYRQSLIEKQNRKQ